MPPLEQDMEKRFDKQFSGIMKNDGRRFWTLNENEVKEFIKSELSHQRKLIVNKLDENSYQNEDGYDVIELETAIKAIQEDK